MTDERPATPASIAPLPQAASPRDAQPAIIGMGASAGGLEALELFFKAVPADCTLAFVVVQHLAPFHKDMLVELLQRVTPIPVVQIKDRTRIVARHIYVIPPNFDLSILRGVLHLLAPATPHGQGLPIDSFFRALAIDQREQSIGVILSGMGSDGTLGLRAIKEAGGSVFVQAPASAKSESMPQSAIDAGLADVTAPPDVLAGKIIAYCQHLPAYPGTPDAILPDKTNNALDRIVLTLRAQTGHDFSHYKKSTMWRRIERRMGLHQLPKIEDYARYLHEAPQEAQMLFKELLIGVTRFFRDPDVWAQLGTEIIPALFAAHTGGGVLRAWVAGCSSGEEAYSLAIVFSEALAQYRINTPGAAFRLQLFATDLDTDAIDRARAGIYPASIIEDVSQARLEQFFTAENRGYRVRKEIRDKVIFASQNLAMDPPFTKLDLLSCRNLLIYLEASLQKKLIPLFHYSLNPGGALVLGSAETIGTATHLFAALPGKTRIYRRKSTKPNLPSIDFSMTSSKNRHTSLTTVSQASPAGDTAFLNIQTHTENLLLQGFSPAAILATDQGDLVYVSGKTGKYLEPAAGKANLNLFAMAREGLSGPLNANFARAVREGTTQTIKGIKLKASGLFIDLTIQPLREPHALQGMVLVVFADVPPPIPDAAPGATTHPSDHGSQLSTLADELKRAQEDLQTTREEMQSSEEELKSTNEELQSNNEELQSTNEELTTSKEEMQSINEELQTVNTELGAKVSELSQASDDMNNLLNSTEIATLFLDDQLRVRRYTTHTTSIIRLIPSDAGRPVTDLASELDYPGLAEDAREELRSLVFQEHEVPAHDGRWFAVRIKPYRTQSNRIDGVVITFMDVSTTKALELKLRDALSVLQSHSRDQDSQLDSAKALESILQQAQAILKHDFAEQALELTHTRATLLAQKGSTS